MTSFALPNRIQSTAGAVPVLTEKGDFRMEKVKVSRYKPGKRPEYAPSSSSEDEEPPNEDERAEEDEPGDVPQPLLEYSTAEVVVSDKRLQRLQERARMQQEEDNDSHAGERVHAVEEPEVIYEHEEEKEEEVEEEPAKDVEVWEGSSDEAEDDDVDIEERREQMRLRARRRMEEEELLDIADEDEDQAASASEEESSDYDELSDSEEELFPRLKPVFVRKSDRITIRDKEQENKEEEEKQRMAEMQTKLRKEQTRKLVAEAVASELQKEQGVESVECVVNTDDENEEEEYEAWKVRELKRIKRDREEIETRQREREELDKVRHMTEEERRAWERANPRLITNQQTKGKYKYLQKYYHRGAFYLDEDKDVYQRNFAEPTLEDHFDKTVLPKVMQVKDFGRAGRTKYTHLVDQDTTEFESPWSQVNSINLKFQAKGGGARQTFDRPSRKKQRNS